MREQDQHSQSRLHATLPGSRGLAIAILFAIGCAAWAGSANAGNIYRGGFDPPAPNLMGFVDISVPDGCVNTDSGFNLVSPGTGTCTQVDVLDATVTSPLPMIKFGSFLSVVTGLWWDGGTLDAITTNQFGPSTSPDSTYFLQFGVVPNEASVNGPVTSLTSSVVLSQKVCGDDDEPFGDGSDGDDDECSINTINSAANGQTGFVRVPEPGSLALVFGALGVGWLALRRRRNA